VLNHVHPGNKTEHWGNTNELDN